jgi:hypothetical protein
MDFTGAFGAVAAAPGEWQILKNYAFSWEARYVHCFKTRKNYAGRERSTEQNCTRAGLFNPISSARQLAQESHLPPMSCGRVRPMCVTFFLPSSALEFFTCVCLSACRQVNCLTSHIQTIFGRLQDAVWRRGQEICCLTRLENCRGRGGFLSHRGATSCLEKVQGDGAQG